jgi:hypothetical protein
MSGDVKRLLPQWFPISDLSGWELRLFLITDPPGANARNHLHTVAGVGLLLEGTMVSAFDHQSEKFFTIN